jgi:hypothetical protein
MGLTHLAKSESAIEELREGHGAGGLRRLLLPVRVSTSGLRRRKTECDTLRARHLSDVIPESPGPDVTSPCLSGRGRVVNDRQLVVGTLKTTTRMVPMR